MICDLDFLSRARVVVIGDVMADHYVTVDADRLSPEAPMVIGRVTETDTRLGGAGNAAAQLRALGAKVHLLGIVGDDGPGRALQEAVLPLWGYDHDLTRTASVRTTVKTRYVDRAGRVLGRYDRDAPEPPPRRDREELLVRLGDLLDDGFRAVLVSDYGKGTLTDVSRAVIRVAREAGAVVVVDAKRPRVLRHGGASVMTPNWAEAREALAQYPAGLVNDDTALAAERLARLFGTGTGVLITRGAEGLWGAEHPLTGVGESWSVPAVARGRVVDVTGAGAVVAGVVAAGLGEGLPLRDAAVVASAAAGAAVTQPRTGHVTTADLREVLYGPVHASDARYSIAVGVTDAARILREVHDVEGRLTGLARGCFDGLHPGHVNMLAEARRRCGWLCVAVNDDAYIRAAKGREPLVPHAERVATLAALPFVDLVVPFSAEADLERLVRDGRPDRMLVSDEYRDDQITGLAGYEGELVRLPRTPGWESRNDPWERGN